MALLPMIAVMPMALVVPSLTPARSLAMGIPVCSLALRRAAPPILVDPELQQILNEPDSELQQRLNEMSERNQRNGAVVLGVIVSICIWLFTVPPDIRRSNICGFGNPTGCVSWASVGHRVAEHYASCGKGDAPGCVEFDFSIDPRSRAAADAMVDSLLPSED